MENEGVEVNPRVASHESSFPKVAEKGEIVSDASSATVTPHLIPGKSPEELSSFASLPTFFSSKIDDGILRVLQMISTNNPRVSLGEDEYRGTISPRTIEALKQLKGILCQALKGRDGDEGGEG